MPDDQPSACRYKHRASSGLAFFGLSHSHHLRLLIASSALKSGATASGRNSDRPQLKLALAAARVRQQRYLAFDPANELPQRCLQLIEELWPCAEKVLPKDKPELGALTTTFLRVDIQCPPWVISRH